MPVHNHESEEGAGLSCNESRLPDGSIVGTCLVYDQFVVENYYGGDSEPVTPDFFREVWGEMNDTQKIDLAKRAKESNG